MEKKEVKLDGVRKTGEPDFWNLKFFEFWNSKFQNLFFYLNLIKFNNSKLKSWLKGWVFKWKKFKIQKLI